MKTIGVVANPRKPGAAAIVEAVVSVVRDAGGAVLMEEETAALAGRTDASGWETLRRETDAIVVLGGDGTLLRVAREIASSHPVLLGVNLGRLGFLTAVPQEHARSAVARLLEGDFELSYRRLLDCEASRNGARLFQDTACNDVVVSRRIPVRILTLDVAVDGRILTRYASDGLIVATPTGSTAHSLSAGGPIVVPETEAIVLTPICPHTLTNRPLILPTESEIVVRVGPEEAGAMLTVDGQIGLELRPGDEVRLRGSRSRVALVTFEETPYFEVLRRKLLWSGSTSEIGGTGNPGRDLS